MKNILFTVFALLILSGCSITGNYNKLRYVKSDQQKTAKQLNAIPTPDHVDLRQTENSFTTGENVVDSLSQQTDQVQVVIVQTNQESQGRENINTAHQTANQGKKFTSKKVNDIDPDEEDPDEEKHIKDAKDAENNARVATILFSLGIVLMAIFPISMALFFIGNKFRRRALASKYNTRIGAKLLKATSILRVFNLVFFIISAFLTSLVLFVLLVFMFG